MSRSIERSSDRTLPPLSTEERAAGARGGTSPWQERSVHGKPEPPGMYAATYAHAVQAWRSRGDPAETMSHHGHGPPGVGRKLRHPWQTRGDPPGIASLQVHGPPGDPPWLGNVRGDPPPELCPRASPTYGHASGLNFHPRESFTGRPPPLKGATGPPGSRGMNPLSHWPPPGCGVAPKASFAARQARGDPPGIAALRRANDPPRARAGPAPPRRASPDGIGRAPPGRWRNHRRGPPGPFTTYSSLSAVRRRGPLLVTRPETARQDAARNSKPKSRKIKPWL